MYRTSVNVKKCKNFRLTQTTVKIFLGFGRNKLFSHCEVNVTPARSKLINLNQKMYPGRLQRMTRSQAYQQAWTYLKTKKIHIPKSHIKRTRGRNPFTGFDTSPLKWRTPMSVRLSSVGLAATHRNTEDRNIAYLFDLNTACHKKKWEYSRF